MDKMGYTIQNFSVHVSKKSQILEYRRRIQTTLISFGPHGEFIKPKEGRVNGPLFKYNYDMTRGSAYAFFMQDGKVMLRFTDEWNGDMYPEGNYEELVMRMLAAETEEDFGGAMYAFNQNNHNYSEFELHVMGLTEYCQNVPNALKRAEYARGGMKTGEVTQEGKTIPSINLSEGYFDLWFSDYIFFKNYTNIPIHFSTKDEKGDLKTIYLFPGEVMTSNFGNDFAKFCANERALILDPEPHEYKVNWKEHELYNELLGKKYPELIP